MKDFICSTKEPIVQTKAGKLRGYKLGTTYTFLGVQYAKAKRWQQPEEVDAWDGVKDAVNFGYITYPASPDSPNGDLLVPHRFWPKSEDCLNLNLWTQSIDRDKKAPVMVWLHGGGFSNGSAVEMVAYDGDKMSEYGDVVVVTVNHRLNVFGLLDCSAYGEEYKNSQNCSMADLVAALKWVHENIAGFGGDPENVTIFGQSGGGMKVTSLMQIPEADGLFHKAIIESGSGPNENSLTYTSTAPVVEAMLKELGTDDFNKLVEMAPEDLLKLVDKAAKGQRFGWGPLENGWYLNTIYHGSTEHAKTIPVMIGTCIGEMGTFRFTCPDRQNKSKEEKESYALKLFGEEKGRKLLDLFYKAYPDHDAIDAIILDDGSRVTTRMFLDLRAANGSAPTYNYMFAYDFPYDDGKAAWHCAEIPFVFHNIDKVAVCNEAVVGERLQNQFCSAWVNFARTGNPNNEYLPEWRPFTQGDEVTMVFDRNCEARVNYDKELVDYHRSLEYVYDMPNMLM